MNTPKRLMDFSRRTISPRLLLVVIILFGMGIDAYSYPYPMTVHHRPRRVQSSQTDDAAATKAMEIVDSTDNAPSVNNGNREGVKATAGAVQGGLKSRVKKKPSTPTVQDRIDRLDARIKKVGDAMSALEAEKHARAQQFNALDKPMSQVEYEIWLYGMDDLEADIDELDSRLSRLEYDRSVLKRQGSSTKQEKKIAELKAKKKRKQAQLDGVEKDLDRLNKKGPPESEIGKTIHKAQIEDLERKKGNYGEDLKKIDGELQKLGAPGGSQSNPNLGSVSPESRPAPSMSLVPYFQFMGDLRVDYRVALGLAEGREETINLGEWMAASYLEPSSGHPFAMIVGPSILASGASEVTVVVPSGEIDPGKNVVVEAAPASTLPGGWEIFSSGSFSRYQQDRLSGDLDGFQSDTWTGTLGLEFQIDPNLFAGIAYSYTDTDTTLEAGQGSIDLTGHVFSGYLMKTWNELSGAFIYSYGVYQNDVTRSSSIGSDAHGSPDGDSHAFSWTLDYDLVRSGNLVMGPSLGLDYGEGSVDGYRERGAGAGNLNVDGTSYETLISSIGWEINFAKPTDHGQLAVNAFLGWEHEYMPEDSPLTAALAATPAGLTRGISTSVGADGAHPGTDWLGLGVNVQLLTTGGWNVSAGYYGQLLRQNASIHTAIIGFSKSF